MTTPGNYLECVQGSELWAKLRCGCATASRAADIIATTKKGEAAVRAGYRMELICERLTEMPYPQYVSKEMQWGLDHEAEARVAYELHKGELVDTCGFVLHPSIPMFGASPDGLVGEDGLIQIKCPTTKTHLEWLQAGTVPLEHIPQMLAELSCTGRDWCDFVSYDPRLPAHLQLFVKRYQRDDKLVAAIETEVAHFNRELDSVMQSLPAAPSPVAELLDHNDEDEVQF
jgi:predicted phage-related endonuclease